eukprot:CAMPEP_0174717726 /NCGR_PEP_ID=MMETSP1094-20130205/27049_1 /TAXON_ID=156173 /ORGANISM="Chrysochromulina brevifilum, Strain UTEX LB 985" /LENGTH=58 /DNA_ID=CAMNT_0015917709 /DNA_START=367 /DNA_END=540 /DNA_ORIENTATION=-
MLYSGPQYHSFCGCGLTGVVSVNDDSDVHANGRDAWTAVSVERERVRVRMILVGRLSL